MGLKLQINWLAELVDEDEPVSSVVGKRQAEDVGFDRFLSYQCLWWPTLAGAYAPTGKGTVYPRCKDIIGDDIERDGCRRLNLAGNLQPFGCAKW